MVQVRPATAADDAALALLFAQYGAEYAYHLGDQDVIAEGRVARAHYATGGVLVAEVAGRIVGCVCFEPWDPPRCRMRRMVVAPDARGQGVGRALGRGVLEAAAAAGFTEMCLDTTAPMAAARGLYLSLGFEPFEADYQAPCREVVYMRRALVAATVSAGHGGVRRAPASAAGPGSA